MSGIGPDFIALFVAIVLLAVGSVGFVWLLDRNEEYRKRWTSSVPTITQLPRATARRKRRR